MDKVISCHLFACCPDTRCLCHIQPVTPIAGLMLHLSWPRCTFEESHDCDGVLFQLMNMAEGMMGGQKPQGEGQEYGGEHANTSS